MAWTCNQTEERLLDAMDQTLGADERTAMDQHVAACANCRRLVRSVGRALQTLHALEPAAPPPGLATKIIRQTSPSKPATKWRLAWLDFAVQPRFLLGALAVLITFALAFQALGGAVAASTSATSPVQMYRQADRVAHLTYARGVRFFSDLKLVYEIQSRFQQSDDDPASLPKKISNRLQPVLNQERQFLSGSRRNLGPWRRT